MLSTFLRHESPSRQLKSPSNDTEHNFLISASANRVSKTNSNGKACIFAVSENASGSIGAAGFSHRRYAHKMCAVFMNIDLCATGWPGQILRAAALNSCMYTCRSASSYLRPKPNVQKCRSSRTFPSPFIQRWGSNFSGFGNTSGSLAIALKIMSILALREQQFFGLTNDFRSRLHPWGSNNCSTRYLPWHGVRILGHILDIDAPCTAE